MAQKIETTPCPKCGELWVIGNDHLGFTRARTTCEFPVRKCKRCGAISRIKSRIIRTARWEHNATEIKRTDERSAE